MTTLQIKAVELINTLPSKKLRDAVDYLTYLKNKDEWDATKELSEPDTLEEIKNGISELKSGNFYKFKDIKRSV